MQVDVSDCARVQAGFQGRLEAASAIQVGWLLLLGRKTGALHLVHEEEWGVLFVREGRIVSAVGPDGGSGTKAAARLLEWSEGVFRFCPVPVEDTDEISVGTEMLLREAAATVEEGRAEGVLDRVG